MDIVLLSVIASILVVIIVGLSFYIRKAETKGSICFSDVFEFFLNNYFTEQNRPRPQPNRVRNAAPRRAQLARNRGARLRANGKIFSHTFSSNPITLAIC